jgi:hypothetical protein
MIRPLLVTIFVANILGCQSRQEGPAVAPAATPPPTAQPIAQALTPTVAVSVKLEGEVATGTTLTDFQRHRLLGHYSTYDGATGFILDRTVTPWKAKLDGVGAVVRLHVRNHPRPDVTEYASDDHSVWLRIDENGTVQGFQGPKQHEGVDVVRDADAKPLP